MIKEEIIGGCIFQEQTTYRVYRNEEDKLNGKPMIVTSWKEYFDKSKAIFNGEQDRKGEEVATEASSS